MRGKYEVDSCTDFIETDRLVSPEESLRHLAILEETSSDVHGQLAIEVATIHEESKGEGRFRVGSEVAGGYEGEVGIGCNGFLNTLESEFSRDS